MAWYHITEEWRPQLHHCESLETHKVKHILYIYCPENWRLWRRIILYLGTYSNVYRDLYL